MNFARVIVWILAAVSLWGADATITFSRTFPGSVPPFYSVTLSSDGKGVYNETKDEDNTEKITVEPVLVTQIFQLADKLEHFKKPLESGLKVANMGQKMMRWENANEKYESKFNYSLNEDARALADLFDRIGESTRLAVELARVMKHDRLGVDQVTLRIQTAWNNKRLVGRERMLPLLDQVAKNEALIHMARERAAQIADAMRATAQ